MGNSCHSKKDGRFCSGKGSKGKGRKVAGSAKNMKAARKEKMVPTPGALAGLAARLKKFGDPAGQMLEDALPAQDVATGKRHRGVVKRAVSPSAVGFTAPRIPRKKR